MLIRLVDQGETPPEVEAASAIDWGVMIDAYLTNVAKVGDRFAASVYLDRSGKALDGMTVVTPPVHRVVRIRGFEMVRSVCGSDHYVIASTLEV